MKTKKTNLILNTLDGFALFLLIIHTVILIDDIAELFK